MHSPDAMGFIPFIHNYCDRRCERCRFVRQCRVGAVDVDDVGEAEGGTFPDTPEDLHQHLLKLMGITQEELDALETEQRLVPNPPSPEDQARAQARRDAWEQRRKALERRVHAHPLCRMGETYLDLVDAWIEKREEALKARGVQLHARTDMDIPAELRTPDMLVLGEALQEVLWFHTLIPAKLHRALMGRSDGEQDDDPVQNDWNGTAKVCVDAVDRSLTGWNTVVELLPEEADDALPMQELLRRIRQELNTEFPDADRFIRPGFDAHLGG
ncbi:MAG: hypothetical protein GFGODING_02363 [Flavobacteriales bacterium]|nr:hypothetical protein [Flavobacteriales bacterium]